jgi:acetoin utilization deacetylase AcuC-like enzyme
MRSTYDVDLPDDTGDDAYLALLAEWLPRLFATHAPRLVFYQAGVDALKGDALGRLAMSRAGLARRNHAVFSACLAAGVPCVTVMGGGYTRPSDASIEAHADVFRAAVLRFSVP